MNEQFKLSKENIEQIERMVNNVISTVEGSDDMELKIIDDNECEAFLYVSIESQYRK